MKQEIENRLVIKDRKLLKSIEIFMGYTVGFISDKFTWNDIMPVIEKIEKDTQTNIMIVGRFVQLVIWNERGLNILHSKTFEEKTKIESAWLAVVEFIKWDKAYKAGLDF